MKLFHHKRAEEGSSSHFSEFVRIALVVGAVILLLLFAKDIWSAVKPMGKDDMTKLQFDKLAQDVQNLLDEKNTFATYTSTYSFSKDWFVAGFDYNMIQQLNNVQAVNPIATTKYPQIYKPEACYDESNGEKRERACLCLYKGDIDGSGHMKNENRLKCYKYSEHIVFLSRLPDSEVNKGLTTWHPPFTATPAYEFLFLYSEEDNTIKDLYFEKFKQGDITYIYITLNKDDLKYLYRSYQKCPDGSDTLCAGKNFDQIIGYNEVIGNDPSVSSYDPGVQNFVCTYSEVEGKCKLITLVNCPNDIFEPCICEGALRNAGLCIGNKYFENPHYCDEIKTCDGYCAPANECDSTQIQNCNSDPCRIKCKTATRTSNIKGTVTYCSSA